MKVQYVKYSKETIENAIKNSLSWGQALRKLNPNANYKGSQSNLKHRAIKEKIDFSHFIGGKAWNKGRKFPSKIPIEVLFERENVGSDDLKKRLFKENLKQEKCELCGLEFWMNEKIPLELHHIDCNPKNNKLINLKIVCSNCHCLEHRKICKSKKENKIYSKNNSNWRNKPREYSRKATRPSKQELEELIKILPMTKIGKMFGVSDNAVRKWIKIYNKPL